MPLLLQCKKKAKPTECVQKRQAARLKATPSAAEIGKVKEEVLALYSAHSSKSAAEVQKMLARYAGREGELLALAKKKFKVEL